MPKIIVNKANFFYKTHGTDRNPALILVSGYTADHHYWDALIDFLSEKYYVITFDNRAAGQTTDDLTTPITVSSMAEDTVALAKALKLEKPIIIGQSMGGAIAQRAVIQHPEFFEKMVMINTPAKWRLNVVEGLRAMHLSYKEGSSFENLFSATLAWVFGQRFIANKDAVAELKEVIQANKYPQSVANQARQFAALEKFDNRAYIANIQLETLCLFGDEDMICHPSLDQKALETMPNATFVTLEGSAHAPLVEVFNEITKTLSDFLPAFNVYCSPKP